MAFRIAGVNPRAGYAYAYERESLDPLGAEIVVVRYQDDAQFAAELAEADAIMSGPRAPLKAETLRSLKRCRAIVNGGVGVDPIDVATATELGIPVVNVPDVWVNEVADHAMLLLLALNRRLLHCQRVVAEGGWLEVYNGLTPLPRLRDKTLGLVAFGTIARNVARRAQPFGLRVVAYDPYVSAEQMAEHGVEKRSLEALLEEADFVSAHAPLTSETHHMLSDPQFGLMKPSAVFVNTGRGRVVDEPALIRALQAGRPAAAGLDVLEQEPTAEDNPLRTMPNVIVTPHVAYYSDEAYVDSRRRVGQEVAAILSGRRPRNCVNPSVLERLALT